MIVVDAGSLEVVAAVVGAAANAVVVGAAMVVDCCDAVVAEGQGFNMPALRFVQGIKAWPGNH
jgi:hypothetical protein